MKGNNRENELRELQHLIEQEKNIGLELFRRSDFESKLRRKLPSCESANAGIRSLLLRPVPLTALIICMFLAGLIIFAPLGTNEPSADIQASLEAVLQKTLDSSYSPGDTFRVPEVSPAQAKFFRLEWSIQYVLNTVFLRLGDENIPGLIYQVLTTAVSESTKKPSAFKPNKQELIADIKTVSKSGDYRFFFTQILKKFQEV